MTPPIIIIWTWWFHSTFHSFSMLEFYDFFSFEKFLLFFFFLPGTMHIARSTTIMMDRWRWSFNDDDDGVSSVFVAKKKKTNPWCMWKKTDNNFDENFYTGIFVVEFCSEKKIFFLSHSFHFQQMEHGVISLSRESFSSHQFMHSHTLFHVCLFALSLFTNNNNNNQFGSVFFFFFTFHIHSVLGEKNFFFLILKKIQNKSKSKLWRLVFFFCFVSHHSIIIVLYLLYPHN